MARLSDEEIEAEELNHHPDLEISFELARKVEQRA
jgi:pterin-4a-carbinolamine dehydratase